MLAPTGWHRHVIRQLAPAGGKVLFLYNGRSYKDQPVLLTRVYDYWSRFLASGRQSARAPCMVLLVRPTAPWVRYLGVSWQTALAAMVRVSRQPLLRVRKMLSLRLIVLEHVRKGKL